MKVVYHDSVHKYFVDDKEVPSVTQILCDLGFVDTTYCTEEGRERGSDIHKAIANHCRGALCFTNPKYQSYFTAFKNFQRDCDWKPEIVELPMGCTTYAGTPDQVGMFEGKPTVIDIKTGSISAAVGLQLVAYEKLYRLWSAETENGIYAGPVPHNPMLRFALQLTETGRYILTEYKSRKDKYIWDSAVSIWHYQKNMRRK